MEYLRNERSKMGRQLEKEQGHMRSLENQVTELQELLQKKTSNMQSLQKRYHAADRTHKSELSKLDKACKERDDAVQSLQRKNKLLREHQKTINQMKDEM